MRSLSTSGRFAVFNSTTLGLAPDQDNQRDRGGIFVRDRLSGTTTQLRVGAVAIDGASPSISNDGRFVAFSAAPVNLGFGGSYAVIWQAFVLDRQTGVLELITEGVDGGRGDGDSSGGAAISGDGRYVAFASRSTNLVAGDTNGFQDVFLRDRWKHTTRIISVSPLGKPGNNDSYFAVINKDGRFVAYRSAATNLVKTPGPPLGLYLYDRLAQRSELEDVTSRGVPADSGSDPGIGISDDGRFIAFASYSRNLLPASSDPQTRSQVYVRDRNTGSVVIASLSSTGQIGNGMSIWPSIDAAGRYVVFSSLASNLVPHDTNADGDPGPLPGIDVFVHDLKTGATTRANLSSSGEQAFQPGADFWASISGDGKWVAFTSHAANLTADDPDTWQDAFIHENRSRTLIRVNAGGSGYTDYLGREWSADRGFAGGQAKVWSKPVSGTQDSGLYRDERSGPDFRYHFDVPAGTYLVRLHFAENYSSAFQTGKRVFDVLLNGTRVVEVLDVFAAVGARTALVREATATTVGAVGLTISFQRRVDNPLIDAIEVIEQ